MPVLSRPTLCLSHVMARCSSMHILHKQLLQQPLMSCSGQLVVFSILCTIKARGGLAFQGANQAAGRFADQEKCIPTVQAVPDLILQHDAFFCSKSSTELHMIKRKAGGVINVKVWVGLLVTECCKSRSQSMQPCLTGNRASRANSTALGMIGRCCSRGLPALMQLVRS